MPKNRILKKDLLSPVLDGYIKKINLPVDEDLTPTVDDEPSLNSEISAPAVDEEPGPTDGEETNSRDKVNKYDRFKRFLTLFDHHEELYTESNLKENKITWTYGIENWLGYPDPETETNHIPLDFLADYVHPWLKDWYLYFTKAATIAFTERSTEEYLRSRYVINIPIINHEGRYVLIKQMSMPFRRDNRGRLISLLNSFTVFGAYQGESMKLEVYENHIKATDNTLQKIMGMILPCMKIKPGKFLKNLTDAHFSVIDCIRIIRIKGDVPDAKKISELYIGPKGEKIEEDSVKAYLRDMEDRLEYMLMPEYEQGEAEAPVLHRFPDPFEWIDFFDHSGIIDLLRAYGQKPVNNREQKLG